MEAIQAFAQLWIFLALVFAVDFVSANADSAHSIVAASEIFTQSDDSHNLYAGGGTRKCTSDEHLEPVTAQDVSAILQRLNSAGRPFKLRASRRGFHTTNGFLCPGTTYDAKLAMGQNHGLPPPHGTHSVTLLMHRMNRVVAVDHARHRLTVEAGMTLQNLADAAVNNGMSIPVGVLPVFANLTVSGVLVTSAHGTGAGADSSLGDLVLGIKWVDAKGQIITSDITDQKGLSEVRGLLGGVGLLGILVEVTLQLLPAGALAQVEIWIKDDSTFAEDVKHQLQTHTPHILYFWRPDLNFYRAHFFKPLQAGETPVHPYYPRGRSAMLMSPPQIVATMHTETLAAFQADIDDSGPHSDELNANVCAMSRGMKSLPVFTDGDGQIVENATIPTSYAMISGSDCAPYCMWTHRYFGATTEDSEWAIRLSDLDEWVKDVRAIVKGELEERQAHLDTRYGKGSVEACMTPGLFWLRFGKAGEDLLAINAAGAGDDEPFVHTMMLFYTSVLAPNAPPKYDHITQAVEQLSVCKYGARSHYGKSFDRQFTNEHCPALDNLPEQNVVEMRRLQKLHDPHKVFETEFLTRVLEKGGPVHEDKCSLTHKCYCKEDSHCADGFRCLPSSAFPQYKVCKVQFSHQANERKDEL